METRTQDRAPSISAAETAAGEEEAAETCLQALSRYAKGVIARHEGTDVDVATLEVLRIDAQQYGHLALSDKVIRL